MSTLRVRAAHESLLVPRPGMGRRDEIGQEPVVVPDDQYYRRRLAEGSLVLVPEEDLNADVGENESERPRRRKEG